MGLMQVEQGFSTFFAIFDDFFDDFSKCKPKFYFNPNSMITVCTRFTHQHISLRKKISVMTRKQQMSSDILSFLSPLCKKDGLKRYCQFLAFEKNGDRLFDLNTSFMAFACMHYYIQSRSSFF